LACGDPAAAKGAPPWRRVGDAFAAVVAPSAPL
jgi:hypothetical protein